MTTPPLLPVHRFIATLEIVAREAAHLAWSQQRLFSRPIDGAWVLTLNAQPEQAESMEAYVSRFGRLQDTIADKLLPRFLQALAERPGSQIEVLNRAERLGVLDDVTRWLESRQLRNKLIHEYMTDAASFADDLNLSNTFCLMLIDTAARIRAEAIARLKLSPETLPALPSTSA